MKFDVNVVVNLAGVPIREGSMQCQVFRKGEFAVIRTFP